MIDQLKTVSLIALCLTCVYWSGCFPEDSIEWSADGSVGVLGADEALYLVDGQSGALTGIESDGVNIMPDISADGRQIAYVKNDTAVSLDEGLRQFPPLVVENIKQRARRLGEQILAGHEIVSDNEMQLDLAEDYRGWTLRYLSENADAALKEKIGPQKLSELQGQKLHYSKLIVTNRDDLADKRVVVAMPGLLFRPRFSPDGRYLAYLAPAPQDDETAVLLVASTDGTVDAMEVVQGAAMGFDWRPDGKALAYIKRDGDPILGTLEEKVVIGDDGAPLAQGIDATREDAVGTTRATRAGEQFVGTLFQPMMHVEYGLGGRIILSSAAGAIPTARLDEPEYSLFCYDRVVGTVTNILPGVVRSQTGQSTNFFRLSPDGKRLLVPLENHRFAICELGSNQAVFPIEPNESFGDNDMPDFVPTWKGNDRIACLVAPTSHFLADESNTPARRKEIAIIDTAGQRQSILSQDWPDEAIPGRD